MIMTLLPAIVDKYMQMALKTFQGHFWAINIKNIT